MGLPNIKLDERTRSTWKLKLRDRNIHVCELESPDVTCLKKIQERLYRLSRADMYLNVIECIDSEVHGSTLVGMIHELGASSQMWNELLRVVVDHDGSSVSSNADRIT
jgi:hypothetical protein